MFNRLNGHDLMEKAQDVMTDSREAARTGAEEVSTFIHEKPVWATLIGAGAGMLIGLLFGRPRRRAPKVERTRRAKPASASRKHART